MLLFDDGLLMCGIKVVIVVGCGVGLFGRERNCGAETVGQ